MKRLLNLAVGFVLMVSWSASGQDIRVLLREPGGKTSFRLGEAVTLDVACVDQTGAYLSVCNAVLEAEPRSEGKLSLDAVNHPLLEDALCAKYPFGYCPVTGPDPLAEQSRVPIWREVTLDEHVPISAGEYLITANVNERVYLGKNLSTLNVSFIARSNALLVTITDDPNWKRSLVDVKGCQYNQSLTTLPDARIAISALRSHLGDCAKEDEFSLKAAIEAIVSLDLQANHAKLYRRIEKLDSFYPAHRHEAAHIRKMVRSRYRALVLETANQLIAVYRAERKNTEDDGDVEYAFNNWTTDLTTFCDRQPLLNKREIRRILIAAGRDDEYIRNTLADLDYP